MKFGIPLYVVIRCHAMTPTTMERTPSQLREPFCERVRIKFGFILLLQQKTPRRKLRGAEPGMSVDPKKNPENKLRFRGLDVESGSHEPISFFYPDYYCRLRSSTGSCSLESGSLLPVDSRSLVGCTTDREFTCTRFAKQIVPRMWHPAPKVTI